MKTDVENIIVEKINRVGLVTLNRPDALNALDDEMIHNLIGASIELDQDDNIGCIVVTGSQRAFAAGADIKGLAARNYLDLYLEDYFSEWEKFTRLRTPKIAAVAGYALGGGCELAMMCDVIYAAKNAQFGQPEIRLGLIPGMGGSQRLTRLVGRARAMDMILTGRMIDADEAERAGLVARVFPTDTLVKEAVDAAQSIAGYSKTALIAAREVVERVDELGLREGTLFERRLYHALWNTPDQQEGLEAFIEKRPAAFG